MAAAELGGKQTQEVLDGKVKHPTNNRENKNLTEVNPENWKKIILITFMNIPCETVRSTSKITLKTLAETLIEF